MRKAGRRQQSAMEYLMTYGWSILIIAIVLAALFSLGVFGSSNLGPRAGPNSCRVYRPNGAGTTTNINLEGVCNGELPEYVAQFSGSPSYVALPYIASWEGTSNAVITVSAWVKATSTSGQPTIVTENTFNIYETNPGDAAIYPGVGSSKVINDGNWHDVMGVWTGTNVYLYVDGVQVGTSAGAFSAGTGDEFIGEACTGTGSGCNSPWFGDIANVQVYANALSANDVQSLYLKGIGGAPIEPQNLVGWWPLDGDTNDYGGNNNNGAPTAISFTSSWTTGYTTP